MTSDSHASTSTSTPALHATLEKVERYLRQQQAILGERIFVSLPITQHEQLCTQPSAEEYSKHSAINSAANSATNSDSTAGSTTNTTTSEHHKENDMNQAVEYRATQQGTSGHAQSSLFGSLDTGGSNSVMAMQISRTPSPPVWSSTVPELWREASSLDILNQTICGCLNCKLGPTRTNFVFGVGNPNADIMVIGEAPGADEDAQGEPFVGRGGQLLTKILEAIHLKREDVYIANIIKCRPPNNRRPESDEVEQCEPYLLKQIELVQPKFILALGLTAVNTLFKANYKMGDIRGKQLSFRGIPLIATYHPAALLRNPEWKKATWEDVKLLRRLYDESRE
jgi:DNA polymerase